MGDTNVSRSGPIDTHRALVGSARAYVESAARTNDAHPDRPSKRKTSPTLARQIPHPFSLLISSSSAHPKRDLHRSARESLTDATASPEAALP